MKKLTAVQWLIHQLITENEVTLKGENYKLFELAKEMEKEQIKEAHLNGQAEWDIQSLGNTQKKLSEQYYNETYKSE
jgi:hypothetical protein